MEKISGLLRIQKKKVDRSNPRGELMQFFRDKINFNRRGTTFRPLSMPRMGKILEKLDLQTLYFMQSTFLDTERRRGLAAACKAFYHSLKVEKISTE